MTLPTTTPTPVECTVAVGPASFKAWDAGTPVAHEAGGTYYWCAGTQYTDPGLRGQGSHSAPLVDNCGVNVDANVVTTYWTNHNHYSNLGGTQITGGEIAKLGLVDGPTELGSAPYTFGVFYEVTSSTGVVSTTGRSIYVYEASDPSIPQNSIGCTPVCDPCVKRVQSLLGDNLSADDVYVGGYTPWSTMGGSNYQIASANNSNLIVGTEFQVSQDTQVSKLVIPTSLGVCGNFEVKIKTTSGAGGSSKITTGGNLGDVDTFPGDLVLNPNNSGIPLLTLKKSAEVVDDGATVLNIFDLTETLRNENTMLLAGETYWLQIFKTPGESESLPKLNWKWSSGGWEKDMYSYVTTDDGGEYQYWNGLPGSFMLYSDYALPTPTPIPHLSWDVEYLDDFTDDQKEQIEMAFDKWSSVIIEDRTIAVTVGYTNPEEAPHEDCGVLGYAAPTYVDGYGEGEARWLTTQAIVRIDPKDIDNLGWCKMDTTIVEGDKTELYYMMLHELGHVLGIGTLWNWPDAWQNNNQPAGWNSDTDEIVEARKFLYNGTTGDLLDTLVEDIGDSWDEVNPVYKGEHGLAAYNQIAGLNVSALPVEDNGGAGTAGGHSEESITGRFIGNVALPGLAHELMTGWMESSKVMPLSIITVGMLEDIGWNVDYTQADPFIMDIPMYLDTEAAAGTKELEIDEQGYDLTVRFPMGCDIVIAPGTNNEEFNKVIGYGSLLLEEDLEYTHTEETLVTRVLSASSSNDPHVKTFFGKTYDM